MSYQIQFPTTNDRIIDTMLAFGLIDLTLRVDPLARFELTLGRPIFLRVQSKLPERELGQRVFHELEKATRSFMIAERLTFRLNVGNREWLVSRRACFYCTSKAECDRCGNCGRIVIPAYAVFCASVEKAIQCGRFCWDTRPLTKVKGKPDHDTIYVGISPYWSKGLKRWDRSWGSPSTYAPYPIPSLLYYGLAIHAIVITVGKPQNILTQIFLSPPLGRELPHEETIRALRLVKRVINMVDLEIGTIIRARLPTLTLPLALLGQLDIPAIHELLKVAPSIVLINYDLGPGYPKNPRGYEEFSTTEVLEFYKRLGHFFWNFKAMLMDLIGAARREEFWTEISNVLMNLSLSIKNQDLQHFNDALLKVQSLSKEKGFPHVRHLERKEVFATQMAIRAF